LKSRKLQGPMCLLELKVKPPSVWSLCCPAHFIWSLVVPSSHYPKAFTQELMVLTVHHPCRACCPPWHGPTHCSTGSVWLPSPHLSPSEADPHLLFVLARSLRAGVGAAPAQPGEGWHGHQSLCPPLTQHPDSVAQWMPLPQAWATIRPEQECILGAGSAHRSGCTAAECLVPSGTRG
jgi:hypothetical protein